MIGLHGKFQEISSIFESKEYSRKLQRKKRDRSLPWDDYSVKQFQSEYHLQDQQIIHQDYSTDLFKKTSIKPPPENSRYSDAWPSSSIPLPKMNKKKVSPWIPPHSSTQFTAHGTFLNDFKKKELNRKIDKFLKEYIKNKAKEDELHAKKSQETLPDEMIHEAVSKGISDGILALRKNILATIYWYDQYKSAEIAIGSVASLDLDEACFRGNVMAVRALLAAGKSPLDSNDDDPLFNRCFEKALADDLKTNSLFIGDNETTARQDLNRILHLLYKAGANVNAFSATTRLAPIHRTAITGNVKMLLWLLQRNGDLALKAKREKMTAAQYAARQGKVFILAEIARERGLSLLLDADANGRNTLHIAALYGQTGVARFLLYIGVDKRIEDNDGLTAGDIAHNSNKEHTALIVKGFSVDAPDPRLYLQYITDSKNRELSEELQFEHSIIDEDDMHSVSSALLNMKTGTTSALKHIMSYLKKSLNVTSEKL